MLVLALLGATSATADPGPDACSDVTLKGTYATTRLTLNGTQTDQVDWRSVTTISVPIRWPSAQDLFDDPSGSGFAAASKCFLWSPPEEPVVTMEGGYVVITLTDTEPVTGLGWPLSVGPWDVTWDQEKLSIAFDPSRAQLHDVPFKRVDVSSTGFRLDSPEPLPSSISTTQPERFTWLMSEARLAKAAVTFHARPVDLVYAALYMESGGSGQYIPVDLQGLVLLSLVLLMLSRRVSDPQPTVEVARVTLRRIALVVAVLALGEVSYDIASQIAGPPVVMFDLLYAAGLAVLLIPRRYLHRWSAAVVWAVLCGGLLTAEVWRAGWPSAACGLVVGALGWFVIIDSFDVAAARPLGAAGARMRFKVALATALAGVSGCVAFFDYTQSAFGDWPGVADATRLLGRWLPLVLVVGVVVFVATRLRAVPLIIERGDRILLASAVGYVLLTVGPQWYAGLHVSLVAMVGFVFTLIVLSVSQRFAWLPRARASGSLDVVTLGPDIQQRLLRADLRLAQLNSDLKAFDGQALSDEQARQRSRLQCEVDALHHWPATEEAVTQAPPKARRWRWRSGTVKAGDPGQSTTRPALPNRAHPVDLALGLGPTCTPDGNMKRLVVLGLLPSLCAAVYFTWKATFTDENDYLRYFLLDPSLPLLRDFGQEALFWVVPLAIMGLAWGSLMGRRGSARAMVLWLCLAVPLGTHVAVNEALHQSSSLTSWLRFTLLLIILLTVGLLADLGVISGQERRDSIPVVFRSYLGLNRALPILLLVLPLITAGVSLWAQIDSGVLSQRVPTTQTDPRNGSDPNPGASPGVGPESDQDPGVSTSP